MALTEKLQIVLEALGADRVVSNFNQISGASKKLGADTVAAGGKLDKLAGGLGITASTLKAGLVSAGAAGVGAIVTMGVKSVQAFDQATEAALNFQRASGATAQQSSLLVAAMDDVGISAETGAKAMFQLGKRVDTSADTLAKFGVVAAKDSNGNVDLAATLMDVADRYTAMQDPAERAAMLNAAFGKSGQALIPILERGRAGIEALYSGARDTGQVFSEEELRRGREYREAMDGLGDAMRGMGLELGRTLVPALTDVVGFLAMAVEGFGIFARWIGNVISIIPGVGDGADDAAGGIAGIGGAAEESAGDIATMNAEIEELEKLTLSATSAFRSMENAERALTKANKDVTDARNEYNKLLREGAVDEEKVADAVRSHDSAVRSLNSAKRAQRKAQDEYNDALAAFQEFGGDTNAEELADAEDKLADAGDSVANATDREKQAARELATARAGDPDFNDKLAKAKDRLEEATIGVKDAEYNLGQTTFQFLKTHDAEKTALAGKADEALRLRTEYEALIRLYPQLAPFLNAQLAGLPTGGLRPSQQPLPAGISGPVLPGASPSQIPLPAGVAGPVLPSTYNITVNVPKTDATPTDIAREISWSLN